MKSGLAFTAGVIGGLIISMLTLMGRVMGIPVNWEMILGTMTGYGPGPGIWVFGFGMHLALSGLFGMIYAAGFEFVTHRAGWLRGLGFGTIHAGMDGLLLQTLPSVHPLIPETIPAPGIFMSGLGTFGIVTFFLMHMIFGMIVGVGYLPLSRPHDRSGTHPIRRGTKAA